MASLSTVFAAWNIAIHMVFFELCVKWDKEVFIKWITERLAIERIIIKFVGMTFRHPSVGESICAW